MRSPVRAFLFICLAWLTPAAARAQGAEAAMPAMPWLVWAVPLLVVLCFVAGYALMRRNHHEQLAATTMERWRLEALLSSVPGAYCGWGADGTTAVSDDFRRLIGRDRISGFEDIEDALSAGDAAALHSAFARLQEKGEPFRLVATEAVAGRRLEFQGARGRALDVGYTFDALWLSDVTDREAAAQRSSRALDAALKEQSETNKFQQELCALLDTLPLPVWLRRSDLSLGWVNRAYLKALDAPLETILAEQRELGGGVIAAHEAVPGRALAAQARTLGGARSERHHVVIGGERRLLDFTETQVRGGEDDERLSGLVIGYAADVTPIEEIQADLDRHVRAHAEVLEHLKSAIAIFGPDKRLKFFNQSYVTLWSFEEGWLESEPMLGEILEDLHERRQLPEYADFPAYKRSQDQLFTSLLEPNEDLLHLPDGTTLRSVVTPHPFGGLLFVLEDVTSSLTLERNYNTLMEVQRESLDNLAEGIAVYGSDGRLRLSNPSFQRIWGLTADDVAGHPHVMEVVDKTRDFYDAADDWEKIRSEMVANALERDETSARLERRDGSVIAFSTVPLPDGGVLNSFLDVTDSVKVEQALRSSNAALETADRLKSEFIANVSYQLRTPLNAIMGFAEILNNRYFGDLNERQFEYTESIIDASQRLLSLINDILDLATIEAGYMALERRPVEVHAMVRNVHELMREWAGKQNLKITVSCDAGIGLIDADERRLKQALYNLVSNAIKFTPAGGKITLSARRADGRLTLTVADTGIGIPEADQRRVLGRFEKAHPNSRHSGVGLGLALVKSLVEMHGGQLELKSTPGEGTTVSCILPAGDMDGIDLPAALDPPEERRSAS